MRMHEVITHPFPPIVNAECEILVLGSFPSVKSREVSFYYGNPKNRFWTLMERLYGDSFTTMDNDGKRRSLLLHHIAVYDTVTSCRIEGSMDAKITDVVYSDIPGLMENTKIKRIFCNGRKSFELLMKAYPGLEGITAWLPSTSPANAAWTVEKLLDSWKILKEE